MFDIVITEFMDQKAVDTLADQFTVLYNPELVDDKEVLFAQIHNARSIIVRNRTQVNQELIDQAPLLRCIGRLGVGLDNIDTFLCEQRNIAVFPATGANNNSVAEYVITTSMMLLRTAYQANNAMLNGEWPRQSCVGRELSGTHLGLLGMGAIARDTATIGRHLGMSISAHDPFVGDDDPIWQLVHKVSFEELLQSVDVLSLHVPLTKGTKHLINASALALMKPQSVIINTARGGVIDEDALILALKRNRLAGAALDVFEQEPLVCAEKFAGITNLYITPHIAGVTDESNVRVSAMISNKVSGYLKK